jgi:hypothetical protein
MVPDSHRCRTAPLPASPVRTGPEPHEVHCRQGREGPDLPPRRGERRSAAAGVIRASPGDLCRWQRGKVLGGGGSDGEVREPRRPRGRGEREGVNHSYEIQPKSPPPPPPSTTCKHSRPKSATLSSTVCPSCQSNKTYHRIQSICTR